MEADSEGAVPQDAEIPTVKVADGAGAEQDAAKELSAIEDELDKATSGKIMNLISSDTYQREFSRLTRVKPFRISRADQCDGALQSRKLSVHELLVCPARGTLAFRLTFVPCDHSAHTCTLWRARCQERCSFLSTFFIGYSESARSSRCVCSRMGLWW